MNFNVIKMHGTAIKKNWLGFYHTIQRYSCRQ